MSKRNLTLLTDLYELTMMQGYYEKGQNEKVIFDVFFRQNPCNNGYSVCAGLDQVIDYIKNLHFTYEDVDYLRGLGIFKEDFLHYLSGFHFSGDIYAIPEGTVIFPKEPLLKVIAPIMEAQLVETAILNIINHQSLIATKTSRIVFAANGDGIMEFGLRRAQGADAAILGARAAVIGGCTGTSNVYTGQYFNIPVCGTHAHSWVMSFPDELTAFRAYAELFPDSCLLLVDTYDTLRSGVPNAIKVFKELREQGHEPIGIRLDSGDMAYLSKQARKMLDEAGFPKATITASSDLDETVIRDLKMQGACIDGWGVGTRLITSEDNPALGGVYKLAAEIVDGKCIFVSGNLCPKGAQYAAQEVEAPKRTIASSVAVRNGVLPLVSVRLNRAVPKEKLFEVMAEIRKLSLNAPVHTGDLIVENILGLGSDLIATKNVEKQ